MINSLTSIRFYLFLSIFVSHFFFLKKSLIGNFLFENFLYNGNFAVTFFFILSGFCIALGYSDKFQALDFDKIKNFIMKRIIKIYPLYIFTGFLCFIINILNHLSVKYVIFKLFLFISIYMTMSQAYFPFFAGGNPMGWFVSAIFFCYILTPFVFLFLKKVMITKSIYLSIWLLIIFVCFILNFTEIKYSYFYSFPPIRFFQYLLGIITGIFYKDYLVKVDIWGEKKYLKNFFDVILIVFLVALYLFSFKMKTYELIFTQVVYIPVFSFTILYLCSKTPSVLNKFFSNKINIFLGNISMECFLFHFLLIDVSNYYLTKLFPIYSFLNIILIFFVILVETIISSLLFKFLYSKILNQFS